MPLSPSCLEFHLGLYLVMAGGGLSTVRDALVTANVYNLIDDDEFVLLYDAYSSRAIFPYWKFPKFDAEAWSDVECHTELRFAKGDLDGLLECLGIPDNIICEQRTVCVLLKRLSYPCRYTDMVPRFGRNPTELCLIFNRIVDFIHEHHHHLLQSWDQFFLQPDQLHNYAQAVHQQGAPLSNCFGFIDGTVRGIARPQENQRVMYNGHKRLHSIKFQSVVIPNGLIANLHGPFEGKRHDSTMLQETGVLRDLRRIAFYNGDPLCVYGDPAYPLGVHLQAPFRNMHLTSQMGLYNHAMSEVRVPVEWLFGNIANYFKFIDFKSQLRINMSAEGKFYIVCALLENAHTCLYGNIVSDKFGIQPPSLQEYFW